MKPLRTIHWLPPLSEKEKRLTFESPEVQAQSVKQSEDLIESALKNPKITAEQMNQLTENIQKMYERADDASKQSFLDNLNAALAKNEATKSVHVIAIEQQNGTPRLQLEVRKLSAAELEGFTAVRTEINQMLKDVADGQIDPDTELFLTRRVKEEYAKVSGENKGMWLDEMRSVLGLKGLDLVVQGDTVEVKKLDVFSAQFKKIETLWKDPRMSMMTKVVEGALAIGIIFRNWKKLFKGELGEKVEQQVQSFVGKMKEAKDKVAEFAQKDEAVKTFINGLEISGSGTEVVVKLTEKAREYLKDQKFDLKDLKINGDVVTNPEALAAILEKLVEKLKGGSES